MIIHNAAITGSLTLNGIDISDITGSEASVGALNSFSSSILSYTASNDAKITALNAQTASILSYTSSNDAKISAIYTATSSLNASVSSLNSYTSSNTMNIVSLFATSASLNANVAGLNLQTASLLSYTASNNANIASLNSYTSSNNTINTAQNTRLGALEAASASIFTTTASLNASVSSLNTYTSSLNAKTASFATTGSNTFTGQQYISNASQASNFTSTASFYTDGGARITKDMYVSGTAYFNNITVFGTQSVSYISSSQLNIGTNLITVNTDTPSIRFGGLAVYDSGSTGLTGSILWDSQNNHWVYSNPSGSSYSGGMFISGPRSAALGSEQGTTNNALMKGQGGDHITSSAVFEVSGSVGIGTSSPGFTLDVNGNTRILGGSTYLGQADVASGHLNAYELMTFNIDVDNDDSNRYFAWYTNAADGAGTELMRLNEAGNVGIGTSSPQTRLHTYASNDRAAIRIQNTAADKVWELYPAVPGVANSGFSIYNVTDNTVPLHITDTGNVGIGTTSPGVKLYVSASDADYATIIKNTNTSGYGLQVLTAGSSTNLAFQVRTNNASINAFQVLDNGNVGIGTTSPVTLLDVRGEVSVAYNATYGLRFYNDARNNWSYIGNSISGSSAANLRFGDSTGEVVRITGGNVGIGTTSPQSGVILDIRGAGAVAGGSEGLRIGNVGDNSAYDNVKLYYTGFNGGAPRVYLTPRTTPGSGVVNTFFHLQNSNGTSTSSNNTMGLIVDGTIAGGGNFELTNSGGPYVLVGEGTGVNQYAAIDWDATNNRLRIATQPYAFGANGGQITLTTGGNVGIGTTSPDHTLDVVTSTNQSGLRVRGNVDNTVVYVSSTASGGQEWRMQSTGGTSGLGQGKLIFKVGTTETAADIPLTLTTDNSTNGGRVGIGTTSPSARLSLGSATNGERITWSNTSNIFSEYSSGDLWLSSNFYGNLGTSGYVTSITENFGAAGINVSATGGGLNGVIKFFVDNAASKTAGASFTPTERMRITGGGNVGIGTTSPGTGTGGTGLQIHNASTGAGLKVSVGNFYSEFQVGNDGTTYMFTTSSKHIVFQTPSTSGNVGIGTTSPTQKLEVVGGEIKAGRVDSSNEGGQVSFGRASDNNTAWYIDAYGSTSSPELRFINVSNASVVMTITGSSVDIGTTQTSDKFAVQGSNNGTSIGLQGAGLVRTYFASAAAGATFDAFRFLTENGSVYKTGAICGYLYLTFVDSATGGNQKSYIYSLITTGNGASAGPYNFDVVSTGTTRGTNPVSSISLVDDGSGGGVKVRVTAISGTIAGIYCYATFVGTAV